MSDLLTVAVGVTANPTSGSVTHASGTTPYAIDDLVASHGTAGSVVVPSVSLMRVAAGSGTIPKMILRTNHTTGMAGVTAEVRLWRAAPTYTNGDNGAYVVATGSAGFVGKFTGTFEQHGDGAAAEMIPDAGPVSVIKLASGQLLYWDIKVKTAFTPQASKTFTLEPQVLQD